MIVNMTCLYCGTKFKLYYPFDYLYCPNCKRTIKPEQVRRHGIGAEGK